MSSNPPDLHLLHGQLTVAKAESVERALKLNELRHALAPALARLDPSARKFYSTMVLTIFQAQEVVAALLKDADEQCVSLGLEGCAQLARSAAALPLLVRPRSSLFIAHSHG